MNLNNDKILSVRETLFVKVMCAPKDKTQAEVEREAGPSGTSIGWKFDETREDGVIQCQDCENRQHWLLFC